MKRSRLLAVVPVLVGTLFVGGTAFASPNGHGTRHDRTTSSIDHQSKDHRSTSSPDTTSSTDTSSPDRTSSTDTPSPDAAPHR